MKKFGMALVGIAVVWYGIACASEGPGNTILVFDANMPVSPEERPFTIQLINQTGFNLFVELYRKGKPLTKEYALDVRLKSLAFVFMCGIKEFIELRARSAQNASTLASVLAPDPAGTTFAGIFVIKNVCHMPPPCLASIMHPNYKLVVDRQQ